MTQAVTIDDVISAGRSGGAIFRAITEDGKKLRILADRTLMPRAPLPGEVWHIGGTIRRHPVHGKQVYADTATLQRPSGRLIVDALARSRAFPGIGPNRARLLWETFGEELIQALDAGEHGRLAAVIGDPLAKVLVDGWKTMAVEAALYSWLDRHGLSPRLARRLIDVYGTEVIPKVEENPYRLLAFANWSETDRLARTLDVALNDPRRLVAAAEAACYRRLDLSHTWTAEADLSAIAGQIVGGRGLGRQSLELAVRERALVRVDAGLQALGPWSMERFIADRVRAMLRTDWKARQLFLNEPAMLDTLQSLLESFQADERLCLNTQQAEAALMALTASLSILTGGAGVGKTTTLRTIAHLADRTMRPIWQMALSGRAAKRMEEATDRPATTIAAFLARTASGEIDPGVDWLLVIDEASMLDLPTLYRILRFMQPGHALLLIGDPGQLAPIGFGLTFHALVVNDGIPRVELTEIHRQAATTGIPQASVAIRKGLMPSFVPFVGPAPGISFIDVTPDGLTDTVLELAANLGGFEQVRIVGATKRGNGGVHTLNRAFHLEVAGKENFGGFCVGEPVLWTRNDYELGLRNGSLGLVLSAVGSLDVAWDDGTIKTLSESMLRDLDHGYAITCHKAQGSQFRRVIVPVFPSRLLDRTLLYTAITRAQEQVVLVGDRSIFANAIAAPPAPDRRMTAMVRHLADLAA
jgi:exodeoxyribonuclease V alpha subunit